MTNDEHGGTVFEGKWGRLEQVVERFEQAWQRGERPAIDEHLPAEGALRHELIVELVHADLECRLKAGESVRAEDYLARYAELGSDRSEALRLIEAEYRLRRRSEPGLGLDEYLGRFPQHRQDLEQRLRGPHRLVGSNNETKRQGDREAGPGRLGQFDLLEVIGQGSFGTVYRARDTELDRIVAVKVPRLDQSVTSADVDRFLREARSAAGLNHAGIVPVYEVGRAGDVPYIVSAYVEGETLAQALARRRLEFRETVQLLAQAAEALDHAHQNGVVHRDLKPSNIMLGRIQGSGVRSQESGVRGQESDGSESPRSRDSSLLTPDSSLQAFVMDFGLARRDEEIRLTIEGQLLGTPAYMSPEQARGQGHQVDSRSDVYSLGVILYELLTGELPFRGVASMVLQQIVEEEPRPPHKLNDRIPRDLETITLKCLAKEPARRYATAGALAADLRRYLNGVPILARPVGRLERCWRWAKRNPRVASLSAAVFLLLAVVAIGSVIAAVQIDRKRTEAEANAEVAKRRYQLALDTLDKLVYEVQNQVWDQPAALDLQQSLLESAIEGLKRVAGDEQSTGVKRSLFSAHQRRGDIFSALKKTAEAHEQYLHCHALAEALAAAEPDNTRNKYALCLATAKLGYVSLESKKMLAAREYRDKALELAKELMKGSLNGTEASDLALCYILLGKVAMHLDDNKEAVEYHRRAAELAQLALTASSPSCIAQEHLAVSYAHLGDANLRTGDVPAARDAFGKSLEQHEAWVKAQPHSARAKRELSVVYERLGYLELRSGATTLAHTYYRKALDRREELAAVDRYHPRRRRDLSVAYLKVGETTDRLGDPDSARAHYRKALDRFEEQEGLDSKDAEAVRDVATTHLKLGNITLRLDNLAAAREHLQKARTRFEALAAADPGNFPAKIDLAAVYGASGKAAMRANAYEEAAASFKRGIAVLRVLEATGKLKNQPVYQRWLREQQEELSICDAALRMEEGRRKNNE